jgi:hypothetical protein
MGGFAPQTGRMGQLGREELRLRLLRRETKQGGIPGRRC